MALINNSIYWKISRLKITCDNLLKIHMDGYKSKADMTDGLPPLARKKYTVIWDKTEPVDYATAYRLIKIYPEFFAGSDDLDSLDKTVPVRLLLDSVDSSALKKAEEAASLTLNANRHLFCR